MLSFEFKDKPSSLARFARDAEFAEKENKIVGRSKRNHHSADTSRPSGAEEYSLPAPNGTWNLTGYTALSHIRSKQFPIRVYLRPSVAKNGSFTLTPCDMLFALFTNHESPITIHDPRFTNHDLENKEAIWKK